MSSEFVGRRQLVEGTKVLFVSCWQVRGFKLTELTLQLRLLPEDQTEVRFGATIDARSAP